MALAWQPIEVDTDPDDALPVSVDPADAIELPRLEDLLQRPAWHAEAACRGQGVAAWFPGRGESTRPAKALCHTCPVQVECLGEAMAQPLWNDVGIWGGTSARERRQLRKSTTVEPAA